MSSVPADAFDDEELEEAFEDAEFDGEVENVIQLVPFAITHALGLNWPDQTSLPGVVITDAALIIRGFDTIKKKRVVLYVPTDDYAYGTQQAILRYFADRINDHLLTGGDQ